MSLAETLHDLRPKDSSAAAIQAAIAAADAKRQAAEARAKDGAAKLPALLLTASDAEIDAAEAEIARDNRDAARAGAVAESLRAQLPIARKAEAVAAVAGAVHRANEAAVAFQVWIEDRYPALVAAMVEGLHLEVAAIDAYRRARSLRDLHQADIAATDLPSPLNTASGLLAGGGNWAEVFGKRVSLPLPVTDARLFGPDMAWKPADASSYS
jgi:hypothetical protein